MAGLFMLALGSSEAAANPTAYPLAKAAVVTAAPAVKPLAATVAPLVQKAVATTTAVTLGNGTVVQSQPASSVVLKLAPSIATEAAWLYRSGWPLSALVDRYSTGAPLDEQANCLATAVYFEARGESVDGQLAVARVVMNRAASGKYPTDWCSVVKQPWQFSFVQHGQFPAINAQSASWARAQGVARLAMANAVPSIGTDVLWYHATYVAPSWGGRLNMVTKIGQHIFYRA